ncbi:MAG: hypothetical protein QXO15_10435 [Nitrososphaerota archaeon]
MVRDAGRRTAKYSAKLVGDVVKNRFDAMRDMMVEQATDRFANLVEKEEATKSILVNAGVPSTQVPFYLSYSRELWGLTLKHTGAILRAEAQLAKDKWASAARGLSGALLIQIASGVYGISLT